MQSLAPGGTVSCWELLKRVPTEENVDLLVDKCTRSQQCALAAKKDNSFLGRIRQVERGNPSPFLSIRSSMSSGTYTGIPSKREAGHPGVSSGKRYKGD